MDNILQLIIAFGFLIGSGFFFYGIYKRSTEVDSGRAIYEEHKRKYKEGKVDD